MKTGIGLYFLPFCDVISFLTVNENPAFLCLAALKAATCRARVTAGTPRHWPRQFRSTMIPNTPCTSPELASTSASPPTASLSFCLFFFSLSFASLSPCNLSLSLHTRFLNLHQSGSRMGKHLPCPDVQQVFVSRNNQPTSVPTRAAFSNQQSSAANPEGFQCTKEKEKQTIHTLYKLSHYFAFVLFFSI